MIYPVSVSIDWLGRHRSYIWNMVPGCMMWIVWTEQNRLFFRIRKNHYVNALFLIGLGVGVSWIVHPIDFLVSLRVAFFPCVHHHELNFLILLISITTLITYQTKKKKKALIGNRTIFLFVNELH